MGVYQGEFTHGVAILNLVSLSFRLLLKICAFFVHVYGLSHKSSNFWCIVVNLSVSPILPYFAFCVMVLPSPSDWILIPQPPSGANLLLI